MCGNLDLQTRVGQDGINPGKEEEEEGGKIWETVLLIKYCLYAS